jgi:membrane-associated phospholipid phosphatase
MIEYFDQLDKSLFLWIQYHIRNDFLDHIMPFMRHKENWFPLYLLIIILLSWKLRWTGARMILVCLVVVIINDFTGNYLIKKTVRRLRPCQNQEMLKHYTPLVDCSSGFSFASNHASNHFALAVTLGLFFVRTKKWILLTGVIWASLIAFAQVYSGVHYPIDILAGAFIGTLLALLAHLLIYKNFKRHFKWN